MNLKFDRHPLYRFLIVSILFTIPQHARSQPEWKQELSTLLINNSSLSPSKFILDKITTHRIVMIGDGGHGDPLYTRTVIQSLNQWFNTLENQVETIQSRNLPRELFLILEMDSTDTIRLTKYLQSGNPMDLLHGESFLSDQFTSGLIEFYDGIRNLSNRILKYNEDHPQQTDIHLQVFGPENSVSVLTVEQSDSFFVYQRDEHIARMVSDLLIHSPDAKALIFYGGGHLLRDKSPKQTSQGQVMGYFMAHHLDSVFHSNGGLYTCGQVDVSGTSWIEPEIVKIRKTIAVDNSLFSGVPIDVRSSIPPTDGTIYLLSEPRRIRPITSIYSESLIRYIIDNFGSYLDSSNEYYNGIIDTWNYYLSGYRGIPWTILDHANQTVVESTITAWHVWFRSDTLNVLNDYASLDLFDRSVQRIRNSVDPQSTRYQVQLGQILGFKVWFHNGASPQIRADSTWAYINKYRSAILTENLIQTLWVSSNQERTQTLEVLKQETGMQFNTPLEWTTWWERNSAMPE